MCALCYVFCVDWVCCVVCPVLFVLWCGLRAVSFLWVVCGNVLRSVLWACVAVLHVRGGAPVCVSLDKG